MPFSETHLQVRPFAGFFFAHDGSNDAVSGKGVPF